MKIAINTIYGGFGLSTVALHELSTLKGKKYDNENINKIQRNDSDLIKVIEKYGNDANGAEDDWDKSKIKIVEIPEGVEWEISNDSGIEYVREVSRTWM